VPLIVYVPNIEPRTVPGAVSPLDLVPTLVDLCGLTPPRTAEFEGESLVPQLFYKQDAGKRVVFSETNAPRPLRAAVTGRYKLVYDLKANVHELYDLAADPWEKKNVWLSDEAGFATMKGYLDDWLERVYYARDPAANQAMNKLGEYLLDRPPSPAEKTPGVSFDDGSIEVLGFDLPAAGVRAGEKVEVSVYFRATRRPSSDFQMQLVAWPRGGSPPPAPARGPNKMAGGGLLPTSRWRDGEHLRERMKLRIPDGWPAGEVEFGLRLSQAGGKHPTHTGPVHPKEADVVRLGAAPLAPRK
jgi:hypothetical protein